MSDKKKTPAKPPEGTDADTDKGLSVKKSSFLFLPLKSHGEDNLDTALYAAEQIFIESHILENSYLIWKIWGSIEVICKVQHGQDDLPDDVINKIIDSNEIGLRDGTSWFRENEIKYFTAQETRMEHLGSAGFSYMEPQDDCYGYNAFIHLENFGTENFDSFVQHFEQRLVKHTKEIGLLDIRWHLNRENREVLIECYISGEGGSHNALKRLTKTLESLPAKLIKQTFMASDIVA